MDGRNTACIANDAKRLVLPVAASTSIVEGHLVALDAGYAVLATKNTDLIAIGRAETSADNSKGKAGDVSVEVLRGVFLWDNDTTNAVTQEHVGGKCYMSDSHTVSSLETGSSVAGRVLGFEDDQVMVETL